MRGRRRRRPRAAVPRSPTARTPTPTFREALRPHDGAERPLDLARTELAYGEFLRRERRRVEARSPPAGRALDVRAAGPHGLGRAGSKRAARQRRAGGAGLGPI